MDWFQTFTGSEWAVSPLMVLTVQYGGGALPNAYYIPRHNIMLQGIDMDTEEENIFMRGRDNNGKWEWVESG